MLFCVYIFIMVVKYVCNLPNPELKLDEPIARVLPDALTAHDDPNCSAVSPIMVEIFTKFVLY